MVIKNNEATINRPEGDRILNAPYVFVNLADSLRIITEEKTWDQRDRNSITVFKGDGLSIILTALRPDAILDKVQTEGFMTIQLLAGNVTVRTPDGNMELLVNQMMVFHPSIQYAITAKTESAFLLSHYNAFENAGDII